MIRSTLVWTGLALSIVTSPLAAQDGVAIYRAKCATCHGEKGDGQGPASYLLYPRPRNFVVGSFRLRSTPSGKLPADADLVRTIAQGIPGTSMPGWKHELTATELTAVVEVVKGFSDRFKKAAAALPIEIPPAPPPTPELVAQGRVVYERMQCASCHGDAGRGDGPAAPNLKDEAGMPIRPYDFTLPGRMKGGTEPADVYRAFTTGLDGTPMPEFAQLLKPEERWQLVHYVRSLSVPAPPAAVEGGEIRAIAVAAVTDDPLDAAWNAAQPVAVAVRPVWSRNDAPTRLLVRAVRSDKEVGLLVEWSDATKNERALAVQDFRDALAVQFPVRAIAGAGPRPFIGMGDRDNPVNIWQWKADWQLDAARYATIGDRYPDMHVGTYHDVDAQKPFYTAWAAGNPVARQDRRSAVEDCNAGGLGTLTSQPEASQQVTGRGVYGARTWRVALRRPLVTTDAGDVQLDAVLSVPIAFGVWDGGQRDRNGQKLFSAWQLLVLKP